MDVRIESVVGERRVAGARPTKGRRAPVALLAGLAMLGFAITSCGGSGKDTGSAQGASASGASTASNGSSSCKKAQGSPVKVMAIIEESQSKNVFTPDLRAGMNARVRTLNCSGGLGPKGAPLQVDFCQSDYDPNQVQACVRKLLSGGYIAAVGTNAAEGDSPTLLANAKVANIPSIPLESSNFTAATTFNINSGALVAAGTAVVACKSGNHKLGDLRLGVPLTQQVTQLSNGALQANSCSKFAHTVDLPPGATDVSSQVTTASSGVDAVTLDMSAQNAAQVLKTRQQLGITTPFAMASLEMSADNLRSIGGAANDSIVAGWYPPKGVSSAGESQFESDMAAIGQTDQEDDYARAGWSSVDVFAAAMKNATTVNRAAVISAMTSLHGYNAGGMLPTLDFSKPGPNPNFPRVVNLTVTSGVVKKGAIQPNSSLPKFLPIFPS